MNIRSLLCERTFINVTHTARADQARTDTAPSNGRNANPFGPNVSRVLSKLTFCDGPSNTVTPSTATATSVGDRLNTHKSSSPRVNANIGSGRWKNVVAPAFSASDPPWLSSER